MDTFPDTFQETNICSLRALHIKCLLRQHIYKTILFRKTQDDYVDLDKFIYETCPKFNLCRVLHDIRAELESLGWSTCLSYADTALFVYTGDKPVNCW